MASNGHGTRVGERLRKKITDRRVARGWGREELAEAVGATDAGIYALENGHYVRASLVESVLRTLGIGQEEWDE